MDGAKARTSGAEIVSSCGTAPLKPKDGLSGPPAQAAGFAVPLWLPREVQINSQWSGRTIQETHRYSKYRSFQVHARLVIE
jgi:hypothetical protein